MPSQIYLQHVLSIPIKSPVKLLAVALQPPHAYLRRHLLHFPEKLRSNNLTMVGCTTYSEAASSALNLFISTISSFKTAHGVIIPSTLTLNPEMPAVHPPQKSLS